MFDQEAMEDVHEDKLVNYEQYVVKFNGNFYPCLTEEDHKTTGSDGATCILELIDWHAYNIQDIKHLKEVLTPFVGLLQALVIWYSCKGKELEDKDFGVLNLDQFIEIFCEIPTKLPDDLPFEEIFDEVLKVKRKHKYQLMILDFIPAFVLVASELQKRQEIGGEISGSYSLVQWLLKEQIAPTLESQLTPYLTELQAIAHKGCLPILKECKDSLQQCLNACNPKNMTETPSKLPFRLLLPFLRKWLVLGKSFNYQLVAILVLHAFQRNIKNLTELVEIPVNLECSVQDFQQFLLAAAHFCHNKSISPTRISEKAYLREYLKQLFAKAGVAKPLYTTYDEKKAYLRSILIKRES